MMTFGSYQQSIELLEQLMSKANNVSHPETQAYLWGLHEGVKALKHALNEEVWKFEAEAARGDDCPVGGYREASDGE